MVSTIAWSPSSSCTPAPSAFDVAQAVLPPAWLRKRGPTAFLSEDHPLAATSVKGTTRAGITRELLAAAEAGRVRIAIGRASDLFGAGATETALGSRVFANALAGKRADFIGKLDLPHTYSYVPDVANGLATLGSDERAVGGGGHLRVLPRKAHGLISAGQRSARGESRTPTPFRAPDPKSGASAVPPLSRWSVP